MYFSCQKREKKEKIKIKLIINGNPTIISLHASHRAEEDTVTHPGRR
jgi:hypothetical protein